MSVIGDFWRDHHAATYSEAGGRTYTTCPRLLCADGFTMSVQASFAHYCTPRLYLENGGYGEWEIGYPSADEDLIFGYAEDPEHLTETVYGYVPTHVIDQTIAKHGGLVGPAPDPSSDTTGAA